MNKFIFAVLFVFSFGVNAEGYNPYNQQYTMNQNYGVSNWMTAFGPGINTAAVTLIGGLVNAMSRPDPVPVQQQPVYVNAGQGYPQQYAPQQGYPQQGFYPQMGHNGLYNAYGQPIQ